MPTLTPQNRSDEVTFAATKDGLIAGSLALIPSSGAVWLALKKSPRFVKSTNWQSRTAITIMPALFMFAYAAESKLIHKMHEVADEMEHTRASAVWAEKVHAHNNRKAALPMGSDAKVIADETEKQLTELYRQSVQQSGVRVISGEQLGVHHQVANYWQENPFKILAAVGVPTIAYIFHGKSGQEHLQLQSKIMHTRVYGQFAVICGLLSLMGFKEYMDRNGKFITESEADARIQDMHRVRSDLMLRLQYAKDEREAQQHELEVAHDDDVKEGHVHDRKKKAHNSVAKELESAIAA